jgi:hypothetical protein
MTDAQSRVAIEVMRFGSAIRAFHAAQHAHFLDKAQAQRKPEIQPNSVRDDLWRKAMALVTYRRQRHSERFTRPVASSRLM